jgi:DNA-binding response OmpR family regulator
VLVVEDDASVRLLLDTVLSAEGYDVATAPDAQAGLAAAQRRRPALVLLDLVKSGLEGAGLDWAGLLTTMAAAPGLHDVPVIVITGQMEAVPGLRDRLGAHAVLTKPFAIEDLLRRISLATGGLAAGGATP